jgi:hypothetical protein
MNVYKLKTGLTQEDLDKLQNSMDESDFILINSVEDKVLNADIIEDGFVSSYMICSEKILDLLKSIFYKYEVTFSVQDITKLFLYGQVDVDDIYFQNYLQENLDIDTILDKISEVGIDSLSDLDKDILNRNV